MTPSQLFLVITSIFSSLGGAYLAILSALGISLQYIIPSMVISAPATFAVCKLVVPESKPNRKSDRKVVLGNGENEKYNNLMEAIQMGAISMLPMVGDIIVSAFTFVTLISWINSTTAWFGDRLGVHNLTIEVMASYVLYPVAYIMGIHPDD
ncbi:solute carrier family 28 member 3, partial [Aplysia californica]|uniref:Solute carrier family 28 member 3 n=1 Tax=Aplysia californica TaxID=6500 RepID=A0ABM1A3Q7_APLCA